MHSAAIESTTEFKRKCKIYDHVVRNEALIKMSEQAENIHMAHFNLFNGDYKALFFFL